MDNLKIKFDEFIYNSKPRQNRKNIYLVIGVIFATLMIALIVVQFFGYNFGSAFTHLFSQSFNLFIYKDLLFNFATLGLAALSFSFAYKSGLFNIGISGQMMGGAVAAIAVAQGFQPLLDNGTHGGPEMPGAFMLTIFISLIVGSLIAGLSGLLKVLFNVHEVVSCILINWIVFFLSRFLIGPNGVLSNPNKATHSYEFSSDFALFDQQQNSGFIAAIVIFFVVTMIIWVILKYTSFGKRIKSVGLSKSSSLYGGYKTKTIQLSSFLISGAIAGLLGAVVYSGTGDKAMAVPLVEQLPTYGFDGIALGLIAFANPIAIIPVTFFMGIVKTSSAAAAPFPNTLADLILGFIMYGTAIFMVFYTYKPITKIKQFLKKKSKYENSYWVNDYDVDNTERLNEVSTLLAKRKIDIFSDISKEKMNNNFDHNTKKVIYDKHNQLYFQAKESLPKKPNVFKALSMQNMKLINSKKEEKK